MVGVKNLLPVNILRRMLCTAKLSFIFVQSFVFRHFDIFLFLGFCDTCLRNTPSKGGKGQMGGRAGGESEGVDDGDAAARCILFVGH